MKNMKKLLTVILTVSMLTFVFTSCSNLGAKKKITVGLTQIAPHASLDNCRKGFIEGMKQSGYVEGENVTYDFQNALGEVTNATTIAQNFVSKKYSLICAIATPSAMTALSAVQGKNIPVIFSAVSDPVSAQLVKTLDKPQSGATGTSDSLNLEAQLKLIRALLPNAKTIGILYTTTEPNSLTHLKTIKELAPKYNFTIEAIGVKDASDIAAACDTLLVSKKVDCINNFTDNNVVNNLAVVLEKANAKNVPVFGSEEEQVKKGCVASESLDYYALGIETGKLAARVLKGEDINNIPVSVIKDSKPCANKAVLEKFGIKVPDSYSSITYVEAAK